MNQQINRQSFDNRLAAEIPLAQRIYAFKNLPIETQENLLRLQNTNGDFLRTTSGETERRVGLLVLVIMVSVGLWAVAADASADGSLDLKRIIIFSVDAFVLLLWLVYLVWGIGKVVASPVKNRIYLTSTELIETIDGLVRRRELMDSGDIVAHQYWTDSGRRYTLDVRFADGDFYQYRIFGRSTSAQLSVIEEWRKKALGWKSEAVSASKRGDTNYLESQNVFSKFAETKTPVSQRQYRTRKENLLLLMTIALIALNGSFVFFLTQ